MKNPLEQFVKVEERGDGVYVKLSRAERDSLQLEVILRTVENSVVMNFPADRFKEVFTRARGGFEKIGPPFEYYDEELENYLNVTITPLKASLKMAEGLVLAGKKPSPGQLLHYLKRKGVVHGIDTGCLAALVSNSKYEQYIDVAFATPPVNGADSRIELKVNISPTIRPQMRSNGGVDFRDIQTFTSVCKGDLLAVKYPAGLGTPGITVSGEAIRPEPGKDLPLPNGPNTETTPDGMQLLASATGIVFYDKELCTIVELLHIDKDVDFSVGNIKYSGDVLVSGSIRPGFKIEAEGSIEIKGEVESASVISRAGHVIIGKGIMGKGDTLISGKKGVSLSFAQNAHITTEGMLRLEKYLLHCTVVCESLEGHEGHSSIIGGEIKAEKSVSVKHVGSDKGVATKIVLFDRGRTVLNDKIHELIDLKGKLAAEMEKIERQLKTKASLVKRMGEEEVSDRQREEVKKWVEAYNGIRKKIGYVEEKTEELKTLLKAPVKSDGCVRIHGNCLPGTVFSFYDVSFPVNVPYLNKKYSLQNQTIAIEG